MDDVTYGSGRFEFRACLTQHVPVLCSQRGNSPNSPLGEGRWATDTPSRYAQKLLTSYCRHQRFYGDNMTNKRYWTRGGSNRRENRSRDLKTPGWPTETHPFRPPHTLTPQFHRVLSNNMPNYPNFKPPIHPINYKTPGQDYDEIRNMTLLFFYDRLVDKGQPRTLHDLSCQFGTKGFTNQMRQIAGGSQAGLRKFLSQYPSLFTIDGDHVTLTNYSNESHQRSSRRHDYSKEAVEYFRDKMEMYGIAEVPIKSLLGHRSQAAPEVRHISGQHLREFRDFLQKFPDVFVVKDEHVFLRKNLEALNSFPREISSPGVSEYETLVPETDGYPELNESKILKSVQVVTEIRDSVMIVKELMKSRPAIVSLDAEGVNLGPSGPMTLLQIGTYEGEVYLFDVGSNSDLIIDGGLKSLLETEEVVKLVHDCRNDSGALYHQFGVQLKNVFDTQAAHAIIQLQQTGKPVHTVKNISLSTLCKIYGGPVNPKKDQMKKIYRQDPKFWSRRPLTEEMIVYASYDILALLPTVYKVLNRLLLPAVKPLFHELCREQISAYINVDEVKQKKRSRKVGTEVTDLKAKLAMATTKQIVLSNREIRLLRYLDLTDEEHEKLEGSPKVARKLERLHGKFSREGSSVQSIGESEISLDYGLLNDEKEADDVNSIEESGKASSDLSDIMSATNFGDWQYVKEYFANSHHDKTLIETNNPGSCCRCNCHQDPGIFSGSKGTDITSENISSLGSLNEESKKQMSDASCQTMSVGDIVITRVFFEEYDDKSRVNR
uniref:3'-5' exonuclease domain-containing protein n=1 Tax=Strigamia maritima TaxID=126957 RepID=T1JFK4_STRMM